MRKMKRKHMLASRGETFLIMSLMQNHSSSSFRVLNINNSKIVICQNLSWHPETPKVRLDGHQAAASGGESTTGGKKMPQPSTKVNTEVKTANIPTTQQPERTVESAEGPLELGVGTE